MIAASSWCMYDSTSGSSTPSRPFYYRQGISHNKHDSLSHRPSRNDHSVDHRKSDKDNLDPLRSHTDAAILDAFYISKRPNDQGYHKEKVWTTGLFLHLNAILKELAVALVFYSNASFYETSVTDNLKIIQLSFSGIRHGSMLACSKARS